MEEDGFLLSVYPLPGSTSETSFVAEWLRRNGSRAVCWKPLLPKMLEVCMGTTLPLTVRELSVSRRYPVPLASVRRFARTTLPLTAAPCAMTVWPWMLTGSSSTASKVSPECALVLEIRDRRRMVRGVPAGTFCSAGTSEELGAMPFESPR